MSDDPDELHDVYAFDQYQKAEDSADQEAVALLYGTLPAWLPGPVLPQIRQALSALHNAGQTTERIVEVVGQARSDNIDVPGTARDVADYIKSANYLAHVQWALSLDKGRTLQELGGSLAAKTYKALRRGKEEQTAGTANEIRQRNERLRAEAAALQAQNPRLSTNALAERLAPAAGLSAKQLRRILAKNE